MNKTLDQLHVSFHSFVNHPWQIILFCRLERLSTRLEHLYDLEDSYPRMLLKVLQDVEGYIQIREAHHRYLLYDNINDDSEDDGDDEDEEDDISIIGEAIWKWSTITATNLWGHKALEFSIHTTIRN